MNKPIYKTTLLRSMDVADSQLVTNSGIWPAATLPNNPNALVVIYIDTEAMLVTQYAINAVGHCIVTVTRGYLGTIPATHAANSNAWSGLSSQFGITDKSGTAYPDPQSPQFINVTNQRLWIANPLNNTWNGSSTANAISATQTPASQYQKSQLQPWLLGKANVLAGVSDAKVLFIGDSTIWGEATAGYLANTTPTKNSMPDLLAQLFTANGIPSSHAMGVSYNAAFNTEFTLTGGWTQSSRYGNGTYSFGTSSAGNLVFAPAGGYSLDTFDLWYIRSPGAGPVTVTATGGTPTVLNMAGANGIGMASFACGGAATNNTVTIAYTSGTTFGITAIEGRLSSTKKIRFANAAIPGVGTSGYTTNPALPYYGNDFITAYNADLTIINLGINDANPANSGGATTPALLSSRLQATISACPGSVILMTNFPSQPLTSGNYANEILYQPIYASLALTNNIPLVDLWGRYGGQWPVNFAYNNLHPNQACFYDQRDMMYPYLAN
jgi:lysophospholipase L1-like esterase